MSTPATTNKTRRRRYKPRIQYSVPAEVLSDPIGKTSELSGCEPEVQHTIMKLLSQFEHVDNATPFALRLDGNISDGIAHGTGPHVAPKLSM